MSLCQDVGRWIDDEVLKPVEQFFVDARQECTEARKWLENWVSTAIDSWRLAHQQRCREQECNWWCLCCNKWFCWIEEVLIKFVEWVLKDLGGWLVETICRLIVEVFYTLVILVIHSLKWIVESVVCFVERFCAILFLLAGLGLLATFLGVVAGGIQALPATLPVMIAGAAVAVTALLLARVLCEFGVCRLIGVVVWALKWTIVLGVVLAIVFLSVGSAFVVVLCGGIVSALIWALIDRGCTVPRLLGTP